MSEPSVKPKPSSNLPPDEPAQQGWSRTFPKSSRILKSTEFRRVYDQGLRVSTRLFAAFCLDTADTQRSSGARLGFTTTRALGKATKRNRMKRRIREALRIELPRIGPQWDIVINPRRALLDAPAADVRSEVRKLVSKCKA